MTFSVNIIGKDFMVMAIDSMEVYEKKGRFIFRDMNCRKMFLLPNNVCVSFVGDTGKVKLNPDNKSVKYFNADIYDLAYGLYFNSFIKRLTLRETVEYLIAKFKYYQYKDFQTHVQVGGIENSKFKLYVIKMMNKGDQPKVTVNDNYGFYFRGGRAEDSNRAVMFVKKHLGVAETIENDPLYLDYIYPMKRRKIINLSREIILNRIEEHAQLPIENQSIGGHIDIVLLTKHKSRWIKKAGRRRKNLKSFRSMR